jgi:hypothetical protein
LCSYATWWQVDPTQQGDTFDYFSMHFPTRGMAGCNALAAAGFAAIAVISACSPDGTAEGSSRWASACSRFMVVRPAAFRLSLFFAVIYSLAGIGTAILDSPGDDRTFDEAGYALIITCLALYSVAYAPFLYLAFRADTSMFLKFQLQNALQKSAFKPLLDDVVSNHAAHFSGGGGGGAIGQRTGITTLILDAMGLGMDGTGTFLIPSVDLNILDKIGAGGFGQASVFV